MGCKLAHRALDGLCRYKFVDERVKLVLCVCRSNDMINTIKCVESRKQLKLVNTRWKMSRVKGGR